MRHGRWKSVQVARRYIGSPAQAKFGVSSVTVTVNAGVGVVAEAEVPVAVLADAPAVVVRAAMWRFAQIADDMVANAAAPLQVSGCRAFLVLTEVFSCATCVGGLGRRLGVGGWCSGALGGRCHLRCLRVAADEGGIHAPGRAALTIATLWPRSALHMPRRLDVGARAGAIVLALVIIGNILGQFVFFGADRGDHLLGAQIGARNDTTDFHLEIAGVVGHKTRVSVFVAPVVGRSVSGGGDERGA